MQQFRVKVRHYWEHAPLAVLLLAGGFFRLVAAIFSGGYAMHDDHFLVIEVAQSWADGNDIFNWISATYEDNESGRSFLYPGILAGIFWLLDTLGLEHPQGKMFFIRLLHAAYSLLIISLSYKIVRHYNTEKVAKEVGLVLALLWLMPYISVRNLAEVVSIPPLLYASWLLLKHKQSSNIFLIALLAGLLFGIGFSLRYQTILFGGGVGLALLIQQRWKATLGVALGAVLWIAFMHGFVEWYVWGYPFGKIRYYVEYNILHSDTYFVHPWYNYFLLLMGMCFPIGIFYMFGAFYSWRKYVPIFLGFLFFFGFHSYFPNKQERFIFTMIPFFILLGSMGWYDFRQRSTFWQKRPTLMRALWSTFWVLNSIALIVFSTYYPKQGKVEAMSHLYKKESVDAVLFEDVYNRAPAMLPNYYTGTWPENLSYTEEMTLLDLRDTLQQNPELFPDYVLFIRNKDVEKRAQQLEIVLPALTYESTHEANYMDRFLHWLNRHNKTEEVVVYKVGKE